jgi:quercetin dioxygenase-like cupin family protein
MTIDTVPAAATALAPSVQAKTEVSPVWFFGGLTHIRATNQSSGGAICVMEQTCDPGVGSPYHVHHDEDEQFYLLDGQMRFVSGDQSWTGEAGTFVFLPRDIPHGFEVIGDRPAHFLLMTTPGRFSEFAERFATAEPGPPDLDAVMAAAHEYGLEILGPLPA